MLILKQINRRFLSLIFGMPLILGLIACSNTVRKGETQIIPTVPASETAPGSVSKPTEAQPNQLAQEVDLLEIPLPAGLDDALMEYSGMAWFGDSLVLLPQYPDRVQQAGEGALYTIKKADLLAYIENPTNTPIHASTLSFDDAGLGESLKGFEGFEAIAFIENQVFLSIETRPGLQMMGYLVSGQVSGALEKITLDPDSLLPLKPQSNFSNATDEAVSIFGNSVISFFEDNGASQNPSPFARQFSLEGEELASLPLPPIEFRITDSTDIEAEGSLWVTNYFYPGDKHLRAAIDPIADAYGEGLTHSQSERVERLVHLRVAGERIELVNEAPIQFKLLTDGESRNWEALVKLDNLGFLLATDKFPRTILAFCAMPER